MVIFGVPVYFLLISGVGMVFAQKIQTDLISRFAASLVIGSSIIGIVMFSLAILDYIYPASMIVVISIAVLLTLLSSKPLWESLKELGNFLKHYVVKNDKWSKLFIVAIVLLVTWLILLSWTPPRQADAMRYHLALSKDIVQNHGLIFRPYVHYNFPLYFNLLFLPVYMAFKGIGLQFAVLGCFILSVIFTLRLAYQLQLKYSRLLVFLFCLIPLFYYEAHQVFNDWVVACYIIMGFVLLLDRAVKPSLLVVFLGFLSLGFALGVKCHAVLFIPWFALLGWDCLKSVKSSAHRIIYLFLALITMGVIASPCYMRNFINTGNPFWPLLQGLFPASNNSLSQVAKLFEATTRSGNHSIGTLINSLRNYVSNPLLPGTVWPLAFFGAVLGRKTPLRIGFGLLTYVSIWWVIQPSLPWRYSFFALPVGLLAVVLLYETVKSYQLSLFKLFYQAIVAITLIYGIGVGVVYSRGYIEYFFHRDLERYHQATWFYPEYMWINKTLPEDAHLLVIVSAGQTYYLDRSYLRAGPLSGIIDWTALKDVAELREKLFQLNIDYVLYEVRDWGSHPLSYHMMELIEKLSTPPSQVIWDRQTLRCSSRMKKEYTPTVLRLIKLRK
jgi:hypothetical protein